jgi:hypothetical protein
MKRIWPHALFLAALLAIAGVASYALAAQGDRVTIKTPRLTGFAENPDVSTKAGGSFDATINRENRAIRYTLRYSGLEGDVQQAHIHFGKPGVNGGVSAFLCSNLPSPPPGTPACPQQGAVESRLVEGDIIGPADQGIEPGHFRELVRAIRSGRAYVNVHSSKFPGGEIRAQIRVVAGR